MPFVFIVAGILFLVLARNGTTKDFESLLVAEFSGSQSFIVWVSAIVILGLIGFFKPVRPITDAFIGLILLVMILQHSGAFAQFNTAIRNPTTPTADTTNTTSASTSSGSTSSAGSSNTAALLGNGTAAAMGQPNNASGSLSAMSAIGLV